MCQGDAALFSKKDLQRGVALNQIFSLQDIIFDVDNKSITHRPDLWSHFGFARELAAIFQRPLRLDPLNFKPKKTNAALPKKNIRIYGDAAMAYYALPLGGARVKAAPLWMQARLLSIGQHPINNIVDTSNYVMFDVGQPNHAFDARRLKQSSLSVITTPDANANFSALDGKEYKLPSNHIVIYDGEPEKKQDSFRLSPKNIVALGGIIGGNKQACKATRQTFTSNPRLSPRALIRRSITALGVRTDSAQRFEKGLDPAQAAPSLFRFAQLLKLSCPDLSVGTLHGQMLHKPRKNKIRIDLNFIHKRLGLVVPVNKIQEILTRLNFGVKYDSSTKVFNITAPSYRSQYDIQIPEDIIEELGRMLGYDNIPPQAPTASLSPFAFHEKQRFLRRIRQIWAQRGFRETYNYSFVRPKHNRYWNASALVLRNPLVEEKNELRLSLLPGLVEQAVSNQDRFAEVRLFEMGRAYCQLNPSPRIVTKRNTLPSAAFYARNAARKNSLSVGIFTKSVSRRKYFRRISLTSSLRIAPTMPRTFASTGLYW